MRRGAVLARPELGVLASIGRAAIWCARRPSVAVLTTGDELVAPGERLGAGMIRNANAHSVPALGRASGAVVSDVHHAGDDAAATRDAIRGLLAADLVVACGGVSVGEHDHVRPAFNELGIEEVFWGLALRPGRPTWFGTAADGTLAFGLPGIPCRPSSPSSCSCGLHCWPWPARAPSGTGPLRCSTLHTRSGPDGRTSCECGWRAETTAGTRNRRREQASHVLTSMLRRGRIRNHPCGSGSVKAGERVAIELLPSAEMLAGGV